MDGRVIYDALIIYVFVFIIKLSVFILKISEHPCPEIRVDNAQVWPPSHGNANESTVVTVRCAAPNPYVLIGDEEVTCQSSGWTSIPNCRKCGRS